VPTRNGRLLAGAGAVLLAVAVLLRYPELAAFGFTALFAVAVAGLWMLVPPRVWVGRDFRPTRVTAGQAADAILTITNRSARRCLATTASESIDGHAAGVPVPSLGAYEVYETSYPLPVLGRGVYPANPVTVVHTDPLRLTATSRSYDAPSMLFVHPVVDLVHPLPVGLGEDPDGPGSSQAPQGGVAFHSLREYVHGDDWRQVHWRSSARTGTLMMRRNAVPNEPRAMVLLDTSAAAYADDGSFENAVRAAASLCVAALRAGFPLRLHTTADEKVRADEDGRGRTEALDLLAAVRRSTADPGLAVLPSLLPEEGAVSLGVVTGRPDPALLAVLPPVRSRFLTVSLVQFARTAEAPADLPGVLALSVCGPAEFVAAWNDLVPR
jgi:uncharacterized protein (DUF58 family)